MSTLSNWWIITHDGAKSVVFGRTVTEAREMANWVHNTRGGFFRRNVVKSEANQLISDMTDYTLLTRMITAYQEKMSSISHSSQFTTYAGFYADVEETAVIAMNRAKVLNDDIIADIMANTDNLGVYVSTEHTTDLLPELLNSDNEDNRYNALKCCGKWAEYPIPGHNTHCTRCGTEFAVE